VYQHSADMRVIQRSVSDYSESKMGNDNRIWFSYRNTLETQQVAVRCACGKISTLTFDISDDEIDEMLHYSNHSIDDVGNVTGPILCSKCGDVSVVQLEGWTFGPMGEKRKEQTT